jgi:hypothetical protein
MTHVRRRFLMLGILSLAATALMFAWGHQYGHHAAAQVPAPGLQFSMAVEGTNDCNTTRGDANCYLEPGSSLTVDFSLDSLPDGYPGYAGYDLFISYTGLSTSGVPTTTEWPDCGFPANLATPGVSVRWACAIGVDVTPSMYLGVLSTLDFQCTDAQSYGNTITMLHSASDTGINADTIGQSAEGNHTTEKLTINCGPRPTATSTSAPVVPTPALPGTGDATGIGGSGSSTGLWLIIGLLAAAAASVAGFAGWRIAGSR